MTQGLNPNGVINVSVNVGPTAVQGRNFGLLCIAGSTDVIDVTERIRYYTSLGGVATDFGTTAPEYLAASLFFAQIPTPPLLAIGRWAQTATKGVLHGAYLSAAQQLLSNFTGITTGSFDVSVNGTPFQVTTLNFSGATSMSNIAAIITTRLGVLTAGATCTWDGLRFNIVTTTTGATATVSYATTDGAGVDVSSLLGLRSTQALPPVAGIALETGLACAQTLANVSNNWYALTFALAVPNANGLPDADCLNVAAFIEGSSPARVFGFTSSDATNLTLGNTTSVGYQMKQLNYSRTVWQQCSSNAYAVAGFFGRALNVDFTGVNTALTMKFKIIIGVAAETLTETQALAVKGIGGDVFVNYSNGAAILQEGTMAGGRFWDEIHGLDALQNTVQTGQFNLLYTNTTKIPQTDPGITTLVTQLESDLAVFVRNGFIAPGVWNAGGFGQLSRGDTLSKGYYVYAPPVAQQSQADREARKAPTFQAAIKLAGAVHFENIIINVNR